MVEPKPKPGPGAQYIIEKLLTTDDLLQEHPIVQAAPQALLEAMKRSFGGGTLKDVYVRRFQEGQISREELLKAFPSALDSE